MKNSILLGLILSVFLFLMIPHVNAIEYNGAIEEVNNSYQKIIQTMNSYLTKNFITRLIDFLLMVIGCIYTIIEKVLAFLANLVLLGGHRDRGPIYYLLYFMYIMNLYIGRFLIRFLNFISTLFDDAIDKRLDNKLMLT